MTLKATILFQSATGKGGGGPQTFTHLAGWSESVLFGGTDSALLRSALTAGINGLPGLLPSRALLLPVTASIVGVRIALAYPRSGRSQIYKTGYPGVVNAAPDVPQMAIQVTVPSAGAVNIRRFTLRGIPDQSVDFGELLPGALGFGLSQYFSALSNFQFAGRDMTQPNFLVQDITNAGVMTLTAVPGWNVGDLVWVLKTKDASGTSYNAGRYITAIGGGGNQITLSNWNNGPAIGGQAYRYRTSILQMDGTAATVDRVVVRKVGRPFESYRGRRSKRKVR